MLLFLISKMFYFFLSKYLSFGLHFFKFFVSVLKKSLIKKPFNFRIQKNFLIYDFIIFKKIFTILHGLLKLWHKIFLKVFVKMLKFIVLMDECILRSILKT